MDLNVELLKPIFDKMALELFIISIIISVPFITFMFAVKNEMRFRNVLLTIWENFK